MNGLPSQLADMWRRPDVDDAPVEFGKCHGRRNREAGQSYPDGQHQARVGAVTVLRNSIASRSAKRTFCNAVIGVRQVTLWVRSCRVRLQQSCPLYPQKLPRQSPTAAAVKGQQRHFAPQQTASYSIQQATKVELYINLKTAKAFGISVPIPDAWSRRRVIE